MERQEIKKIRLPLPVFCFLSFASCFLLLVFCPSAHAQSPGFTISPVKTFLRVTRGEERRGVMQVVNTSASPLPLQTEVQLFGVSDEQGSIALGSSQGIASGENPGAWITLAEPYLLLAPGETRTVPYTISIPADAPLGGYALALVIQSKFPFPGDNGVSAQLLPAIGSLFFIDIMPRPGEALPGEGTLRLAEFAIQPETKVEFKPFGASVFTVLRLDRIAFSFVERSPLAFRVRLVNDGKYIGRPSGVVHVKSMFLRAVGEATLPDGVILPGTARTYTIRLDARPRFGSLGFIPSFLKESFLPGRYTAELSLAANMPYEADLKPKTIAFWALPRLFLLSTILPLTILGIFMVLYRRRILSAIKAFIWQK